MSGLWEGFFGASRAFAQAVGVMAGGPPRDDNVFVAGDRGLAAVDKISGDLDRESAWVDKVFGTFDKESEGVDKIDAGSNR